VPELPEVETTRRALEQMIDGTRVAAVQVRERRLRRPLPRGLAGRLAGARLGPFRRRAKYLLIGAGESTLIVHLGMSGSLRVAPAGEPPRRHDHVELLLEDGRALRYHDPRRFGLMALTGADPLAHPLLAALGPEPLEERFDGAWLARRARGRRVAVKAFLMDSRTVAGVGNIYAAEALFAAGIDPRRAAGRIAPARYERLAAALRAVLEAALREGGTTLRDYLRGSGEPGYFRQRLAVYGRAGEPCRRCGAALREQRIAQRATCFCPRCQR